MHRANKELPGRVQCSVGKKVLIPVGSTDGTKAAGLIGMKVTRTIRMGSLQHCFLGLSFGKATNSPGHLLTSPHGSPALPMPSSSRVRISHPYVLKCYPLFLR